MKFPNDDDGIVLKKLYKKGVNFKELHDVDFFVAVPDKVNGINISESIEKEGINCELYFSEESDEWTCYCYINMYLKYEDIIQIQQLLNDLSKPFGGYSDGWGLVIE